MSMTDDILAYWIDELGPKGWYAGGEEIDDAIRARYLSTWEEARAGGLGHWLTDARGALAYIILLDQFPRNMFRGDARSFEMDPVARSTAKMAMDRGWDMEIEGEARQFFYLPLMHSENLVDQDRSVDLFSTRMEGDGNVVHAKAHRKIIRDFGRFPYRNDALGRKTTPEEQAFMDAGGYATVVKELSA